MSLGLRCEILKRGALLVAFNQEDKIIRLEFSFDTVSFWRQLQEARGSRGPMEIMPTSVAAALRPSAQARMLVDRHAPNAIVQVNAAWTNLFGFSLDDVKNLALKKALVAQNIHAGIMDEFLRDLLELRPTSMEIVILRKDGTDIRVFCQAAAVTSHSGEASNILVTVELAPPPVQYEAVKSEV